MYTFFYNSITIFVFAVLFIHPIFAYLYWRRKNDIESADALFTKTADQILDLMVRIESSEECDICWIGPGLTSFERLWHIYTELVGNDEKLQEQFPHYA